MMVPLTKQAQTLTRATRQRLPLRLDEQIALATLGPFGLLLILHLAGMTIPILVLPIAILGAPHVLSTFGLYADRDLRGVIRAHPRRYLAAPVLCIVASVLAFALITGPWLTLLLTGFLLWQTHHFTKQNLGMFSFWCRSKDLRGADERERTLVRATTALGAIGILRLVGLVPEWDSALRIGGMILLAIGFVLVVSRPEGARTMALLIALAFYAPLVVFSVDLFAAALIYQATHGAQYYLMVGHVVHGERRVARQTLGVVAIGGLLMVASLEFDLLVVAPAAFGLFKGIVAAHFIADASLWKMRDPTIGPVLRDRFGFG